MSDLADETSKLISEVRHETNNSLMAILGYVELLLMKNDLPADVVHKLRNVETEAQKIRDQIARTNFIRRPSGP